MSHCPSHPGPDSTLKCEEPYWREDNTCSYCGSLNPEKFLKLVREGHRVTPTDKNYKVYVAYQKFYFEHCAEKHFLEFVDLMNNHQITFDEPGHFYVKPFFLK